METGDIIILSLLAFFVVVGVVGYRAEKRAWNNGRCSECGSPWVSFDVDSAGATGYVCQCSRRIWITFPFI